VYHPITQILYNEFWQKNHFTGGKERKFFLLKKLSKVDLLIIDELGYVELSNQVTQLMFQIFSERYEKGSILINSNLEFAE